MRRILILLMMVAAMTLAGADAYNTGVQAYNKGDKATAEKVLTGYVEGGGTQAMAYIILGEIAKGKAEHARAANYYEKAGEIGKGKNRCTGYRCLIYSLTKAWDEKGIPRGDEAAKILAEEYTKDGDAKVAIGYWSNRRGYEYMKAKDFAGATPWFEKAVEARPDFPLFANNLAVVYCERAEKAEGKVAVDLAAKAISVLKAWEGKRDVKLDATRARAEKIIGAK